MRERVLILSASVGMGHVRAGEALESAFFQLNPSVSVHHEDSLKYTNAAFRNLYSKAYADFVSTAPELLGCLYNYTDRVWKSEEHGLAFERFNAAPLIKLVRDYQPDAVVCTHSLPADIISWLLCKQKIDTQHAVVLTDFDIHAVWLCHHYSRYFVALDETKEHMERLGFDPNRIRVSGIPVDPMFGQEKDKRQMRLKYDLDPDCLTILISAGGFGMVPMEQILLSLSRLKHKNQIIAICGHNDELKSRVQRLADSMPEDCKSTISVVGFTSSMDEYMAASDLIIGKPGGLTSSEALVKGLVSVIVCPIPGQEERNADHLIEEGAAIRCNNLPTLAFKIERLLNNPQRLIDMRNNALRLSSPFAADKIAADVLGLIRSNEQVAIHPESHVCEGIGELAVRKVAKVFEM